MASIYNRYCQELQKDKAIQWLKQNDPQYSNKNKNKDMEYPYLTKRKELIRESKEIPISNTSPTVTRNYLERDE